MKERKQLHKLVIATLKVTETPVRAITIYQEIRELQPSILKDIRGIKSFAKILNQFPEIKQMDKPRPRLYILRKA